MKKSCARITIIRPIEVPTIRRFLHEPFSFIEPVVKYTGKMKMLDEFQRWDIQDNLLTRKMRHRSFYERYAMYYRWKKMIEEAHLRAGESAIDLGGGLGFISVYCSQHNHETVHVDDEESLLAFAKSYEEECRGGLPVHFLKANLENLEVDGKMFDVVFCGEVLEHINDVENFLKTTFDLLRPGGRLILTTPNRNALAYVVLRNLPTQTRRRLFSRFSKNAKLHAEVLGMQQEMPDAPEVHKRVGFSSRELVNAIESAGYQIIKHRNFGFLVPSVVVSHLPTFLCLAIHYTGKILPWYSAKHLVVARKPT